MVGDDLDQDEDEFPPLPADLVAAVDELLSEFDDEASLEEAAVRELLWTVLERVGRLDEYRISETMGGWSVEDARDEEHRRRLIEEDRPTGGTNPACGSSCSFPSRSNIGWPRSSTRSLPWTC